MQTRPYPAVQPGVRLRVLLRQLTVHHLVFAVAAAYVGAFALTGVLLAIYPYPIDGLEHGGLQEVDRLRAWLPLYVAPSLDYTPLIYAPGFFYLAALVGSVVGSSLMALRLVSVLASLGSMALIVVLVRRETGSVTLGLVGAGLLAASSHLVDGAMAVGRTDATALFFVLAAIWSARKSMLESSSTWRSAVAAGALIGIGLLTKQTVAAIALIMLGLFVVLRRDQAVLFGVTFALTAGLGFGWLLVQSGWWPIFYLWEVPRSHQILPELLTRFWDQLVGRFTVPLLVAPFYLVARALVRDWRRLVFYGGITLALVGGAWASQATIGGGRNVEIPAYAAVSLLFALALHEVLVRLPHGLNTLGPIRAYVLAMVIGQFAVMVYNPRLAVPYRSDMWAGDRLRDNLAALPRPIFAGSFQGFVHNSADVVAPDLNAVLDLQGEQVRPATVEGDRWSGDFAGALDSRRFTYVIVDTESNSFSVPLLLDAYGYVDVGPLFPPGDKYWEWRTGWSPKAEVYARPDLPRPNLLPPASH